MFRKLNVLVGDGVVGDGVVGDGVVGDGVVGDGVVGDGVVGDGVVGDGVVGDGVVGDGVVGDGVVGDGVVGDGVVGDGVVGDGVVGDGVVGDGVVGDGVVLRWWGGGVASVSVGSWLISTLLSSLTPSLHKVRHHSSFSVCACSNPTCLHSAAFSWTPLPHPTPLVHGGVQTMRCGRMKMQ
ncbi:unnamed protein product [Closterium sp. Yama58-4]|nr:unnamed protein product [Closterium sp. Yama58-4]